MIHEMSEFIGKKIKAEYAQETGWRRPVKLKIGKRELAVNPALFRKSGVKK